MNDCIAVGTDICRSPASSGRRHQRTEGSLLFPFLSDFGLSVRVSSTLTTFRQPQNAICENELAATLVANDAWQVSVTVWPQGGTKRWWGKVRRFCGMVKVFQYNILYGHGMVHILFGAVRARAVLSNRNTLRPGLPTCMGDRIWTAQLTVKIGVGLAAPPVPRSEVDQLQLQRPQVHDQVLVLKRQGRRFRHFGSVHFIRPRNNTRLQN